MCRYFFSWCTYWKWDWCWNQPNTWFNPMDPAVPSDKVCLGYDLGVKSHVGKNWSTGKYEWTNEMAMKLRKTRLNCDLDSFEEGRASNGNSMMMAVTYRFGDIHIYVVLNFRFWSKRGLSTMGHTKLSSKLYGRNNGETGPPLHENHRRYLVLGCAPQCMD